MLSLTPTVFKGNNWLFCHDKNPDINFFFFLISQTLFHGWLSFSTMIIISFELFLFTLRLVTLTWFQGHEGVVNLLIHFVIFSAVPSLPRSICTHLRESTNCSSSCSPCTSQTAHITRILGQLHWLPADARILWICIPPFQRCYLHFHSRLSLWSPAAVLSFLVTSLRCWYLPPATPSL